MFFYVTKSDVFTLGKDLVHMFCRGFLPGGLARMLKHLQLSKSNSLAFGKNLTYVEVFHLGFHQDVTFCLNKPDGLALWERPDLFFLLGCAVEVFHLGFH